MKGQRVRVLSPARRLRWRKATCLPKLGPCRDSEAATAGASPHCTDPRHGDGIAGEMPDGARHLTKVVEGGGHVVLATSGRRRDRTSPRGEPAGRDSQRHRRIISSRVPFASLATRWPSQRAGWRKQTSLRPRKVAIRRGSVCRPGRPPPATLRCGIPHRDLSVRAVALQKEKPAELRRPRRRRFQKAMSSSSRPDLEPSLLAFFSRLEKVSAARVVP